MKYIAPKLSANDDILSIVKLYFKNGDFVRKGDAIADLESTKTTHEFVAEIDEKIFFYYKEGETVKVGDVFAEQSADEIKVENTENIKTIFTESALKLLLEHDLSKDMFSSKAIVQSKDVEAFLNKKSKDEKGLTCLIEKYPLLNSYEYIPSASIEFEYESSETDSEACFWKKLFESDLPVLLKTREIHNFVYDGNTLHLYPIKVSSSAEDYRLQLNNATLETFRGNPVLSTPIICVSFLKSSKNFKHTPLIYKGSIITIGIAEIIPQKKIRAHFCYDHRFIDGYTILRVLEKF